MTTPIRSNLEENSGDEDDCQELVAESFVEEPDAGEHFMQATSEFFSKMGYWLYNSRVVQYIARDERVRVKTVFQTEDIWILGVCYTLESNEPTCSLPETSRSRKLSSLQQQHSSRIGDSRNHTIGSLGAGSDNHRDSKRPWERKMAYSSTSPRAMTDNDSIFTFTSTAEGSESGFSRLRSREQHPERQREKELAKARKMAKELEKEEKAREKAKEKAKLKEEEKHQRLKAKISQPRFDPNNLREGTKDLSEVLTSDTKDQLHPQFRTETNRKSRSIHGYNHEEMSNVGLGLTTPSGEPKQSVIRRMRSISILQKTPSAVDALAQKKFVHDSQFGVLPDRTNQPRSQSISNISVLSQRSTGTSSLSSHDGQSRRRPTSPSPPSSVKKPLSVHEALAACPRPNVLSKLSHLNLDKKKLPDLPPLGLDDIPDIPIHPYQDPSQPERDDLTSNVHTYASVPIPDVPDTDTTEPTPTSSKDSKSGKRRMTISGIFSKDPKPSTTGGLAVLKTLVNASKISLRPKAEDPTPISRHQSPASIGTATATISFVPQPPGSSSSKKGGVTKNMQHWIERRISSNNLHQQAFVASTNEPVPLISKDVVLPPTSSPLTMRVSEANTLTQASERQQENDSQHLPSRMRKKSSIFSITSTSSAISSPLSVFKSGSPQSASSTKTFSTMYPLAEPLSIEQHNIGEAHIAFAPAPPPPQNSTSLSEVKIDKDTAPEPKLDCKVREEPDWMVPSTALDYSTSKDLVILPPLPPEPPSEAFILLNNRASSSAVSLERDLEGSVLISMPEAEEASCATASDASIQKKLLNKDIIRTENNCLFDQLAAFSNDKSESISDLRSEWESLWPSKSEANQVAGMDTVDFVHVQKTHGKRSSHLKDESLTPQERERIRKIGSTYVKVKNPTPEIVAPQPKAPLLLQSQVLHNHDSGEVPRSSSPEVLKDSPGEKSSPLSDRLLRPFTLITALPPQVSPPSPSPSLSKSWRAMSPRPHSPAFSLPFLSSSKPASSRSVRVQASSSITNKEDITGDDENASVEIDIAPRKAVSPSTLQSPTAYLSLDKPVSSSNLSTNQRTLQRFMLDFQSKFWFTYRKDIARIDPSYFTSDAGWGCMMRTGQSLLAQAFAIVLLGREWRAYPTVAEENTQKYRTLLSWFADEPEQPYSIHNIAKAGLYLDKRVGEWFGPSTVAHALKRLSEQHIDCPLHVMVSMENTVRFSDILKLATEGQSVNALAGPTRSQWKPVVILMPSRFGREKLIDRYVGNLKQLFKLPQFLGIAGGRPGRSLYFIASQGNDLFYLDPHFVKPRATYEELLNVPSTSYHCGVVRAMDIMEMDPSMMLGFLIRSTRDLLDLSTRLKNEMESGLPLLTLLEDIPLDIQDEDCQESDNQNIVSAEVQPHPKSHDESADKVLGGQSDPEYIPGLNNGHPSETQLLYGHKSGMSRIIDTSTETYKAQASMLPKQDPSETHLQQDHSSLQPKREMKRITRTLKSPMPVAKSIDGGITSRRATELYQHQRTIQNGNHMHDDDNLSVHSFDSDVSIA
ncbi:Cysteine protease atg4b [Mortierella sp. AM989]|nr:Cysteine protease atg4b [Mortierella sp. AM989]